MLFEPCIDETITVLPLQLSKNKKEEQLCNYELPKETDFVPESYFNTTFISNYIISAS